VHGNILFAACATAAIVIVVAAALLLPSHGLAEGPSVDVTLRWDYEAAGAAGFVLYCGTSSQWYTIRLDVGNTDTTSLSLEEGAVHFCAVNVYDAAGVGSPFSNEVAIAVTDAAAGLVSVEAPIAVAQDGDSLSPTATGFRVRFSRPFDLNALDLLWTDFWLETPEVALVGSKTGIVRGSIVADADNRGFTFVKTDGVLVPDSYTLTLRSSTSGLIDAYGRPLDGNGDGIFGDDFVLSFAVLPSNDAVVAIGEFARGPGQPARIPAGTPRAGIPVDLINGVGVADVEFTLRYTPTFLKVLGVRPANSVTGDVTLAAIDNEAGVARIRIEGLGGLTAASTGLLVLEAEVPTSAHYAGAHVLDISELRINGGSIAARDDDGLHVVAYLGDVTGNGTYSSLDLARMQRLVLGSDWGLSAYPRVDPAILADITANGSISSLDMARLSEWIRSGFNSSSRPEFEPLPGVP